MSERLCNLMALRVISSTEQTAEQELNPFPHPIFIRAEGIALDDARLAVVDNLVDVGA